MHISQKHLIYWVFRKSSIRTVPLHSIMSLKNISIYSLILFPLIMWIIPLTNLRCSHTHTRKIPTICFYDFDLSRLALRTLVCTVRKAVLRLRTEMSHFWMLKGMHKFNSYLLEWRGRGLQECLSACLNS